MNWSKDDSGPREAPRGYHHGNLREALAETYASADVFVFPSRTDTFGIVLIEAMASGLPVAAFPVPGPIDVVGPGAGALDEDLRAACLKALTISGEAARAWSMRYTWRESARQFLDIVETNCLRPARRRFRRLERVGVA